MVTLQTEPTEVHIGLLAEFLASKLNTIFRQDRCRIFVGDDDDEIGQEHNGIPEYPVYKAIQRRGINRYGDNLIEAVGFAIEDLAAFISADEQHNLNANHHGLDHPVDDDDELPENSEDDGDQNDDN